MNVSIDRSECIGSAMCMSVAPDVFDLDEEHKAYLLRSDLDDDRAGVDKAVAMCPMDAISVVEDGRAR